MKVEYINPFLRATQNVLKTMAFTDTVAGKPYVKKNHIAGGDISGIIGVTGDTQGSLSISFSAPAILSIVSKMFGEPATEINPEIEDAVGEITNMISGDARRELDEKGLSLKSATPSVVSGKDHSIKHMASGPTIAIPFSTQAGHFVVEVCLND